MSFWNLSDDEDVTKAGGEYDAGGGTMEPIPEGTSCLAAIDEAKWDKKQDGSEFISLRWTVLAPEEYKNRKVFQKLWVTDDDPQAKDPVKKRDKAKKMLAAVDTNAGGKLMAKPEKPTNESLSGCLTNKPMIVKVMLWKMTNAQSGEEMSGNWISAVSPRSKGGVSTAPAPAAKPKAAPKPEAADDDIPF